MSRYIGRQQQFLLAFGELLKAADFTAFGVGIRKDTYRTQWEEVGLDPYLPADVYVLAIVLLLERVVDFLTHREPPERGRLTLEGIGPKEDVFHQLEYARVLHQGSQWVPESAFRDWLEPGLHFSPKCGSDPTEIADAFARDLFEWVRSDCKVSPLWWGVFNQKIYRRGNGLRGKFGVKIFPDSDLRQPVLDHRAACGVTAGD